MQYPSDAANPSGLTAAACASAGSTSHQAQQQATVLRVVILVLGHQCYSVIVFTKKHVNELLATCTSATKANQRVLQVTKGGGGLANGSCPRWTIIRAAYRRGASTTSGSGVGCLRGSCGMRSTSLIVIFVCCVHWGDVCCLQYVLWACFFFSC